MKNFVKTLTVSAIALTLTACSSSSSAAAASAAASTAASSASAEPEVLTVIATANPHAVILEEARPILLEQYNIDLQVTVTDDYYTPNEAVSNGDADANFFQHIPFFNNEKATNGYKISNVGGVEIEPFGIYSQTITDVADVPDGAEVVISNSVADNGLILAILDSAGLVNLPDDADVLTITIADIDNDENNPKHLQFTEVKPELLVTAYENGEGDLVAINGNYAIQGGLKPAEDALILEAADASNPYVNIVACQEGHENDYKIQALITVLQSEEIKDFIRSNWPDGSVIPAE